MAVPPRTSTLVGTLLNARYRLDAKIGSGGMSAVYRAFDTVLERQVAIKLMHREIASDSDQLERFRREARAVARLNHPHIVTVIDAGEDERTPYIVFEYIEGETLKHRIRRLGRLEIPEAVAYAIEVARALGAAHTRGIVHRDVKPQNVLVDSEGTAKITDFGIARTLTEEGLTAEGRVLGTTDYVAPEQALGHAVTGQSDIYSLGVVLYEMLTGSVPFTADNQVAVAMRHVREEVPDVQSVRPEVSAALAAVVERATEKSLERRYQDADALVADLGEALAIETARSGSATGEATTVLRTLPGRAQRRLPVRILHPVRVALLAALLLAIAGGVAALIVANTHRGNSPAVAAPPQETAVRPGQDAAHDYNPFGNSPENPSSVALAIDGDPNTFWSTEQYYQPAALEQKGGAGIYVDYKPGTAGRSIELQTPTPGFAAQIWGADHIVNYPQGDRTKSLADRGWTELGASGNVTDHKRIGLDTASHPFRYYLVWIRRLPPNSQSAKISEITLFR